MIRTIIIEDDPMVAQINCQYLQPLGDFQIDGIFNSGAAAQEYLKENEADLAIVDIYMPGMNGIELLRWIRGDHRNLSVIMVTAATEIQTVAEALQLGIVDYLIKPLHGFRRRCRSTCARKMYSSTAIRPTRPCWTSF